MEEITNKNTIHEVVDVCVVGAGHACHCELVGTKGYTFEEPGNGE